MKCSVEKKTNKLASNINALSTWHGGEACEISGSRTRAGADTPRRDGCSEAIFLFADNMM